MAINYTPKDAKIVEALIFLIDWSVQNRKRHLTQYDLVKTMFLADRAHLNRYGRPVSFDKYWAMKDGPVPERTYDILKPTFDFEGNFKESTPWVAILDGKISNFIKTKRGPNLKKLSGTDQKVLLEAINTVLSLSFSQLRRLTHDDQAYIKAWGKRGRGRKRSEIEIDLFMDDTSIEDLAEMGYVSQFS